MTKLSVEAVRAGLREASRILAGERPTEDQIAIAPTLSAWGLEPLGGGLYRLVGMVSGHPELQDGPCFTSVVLVMDDDRRWARTVSRVYALGPSIGEVTDSADADTRSGHERP